MGFVDMFRNVWAFGISITQGISVFQMTSMYIILQNHAWVKDLLKMQDRPMNFNVTRVWEVC